MLTSSLPASRPARLGAAVLLVLLTPALGSCSRESVDEAARRTSESTAASAAPVVDTGYSAPALPDPVCDAVSAEEMGEALGADVTVEVASDTDCTFAVTGQEITVRLVEQFDSDSDLAAVAEVIGAAYGTTTDLDLDLPAVVAAGEVSGSVAGAGAVRRGGAYVTGVRVTQGEGLPVATVKAGTVRVLELVAEQA